MRIFYQATLKKWIRLMLLMVVAAPISLGAAVLTFNIIATISVVDAPLATEFAVGESVTGTFSFDTNTPDVFPGDPSDGVYIGTGNRSFLFGDYLITGSEGNVQVENKSFDLFTIAGGTVTGGPVGALSPISVAVVLHDIQGLVFSSDGFPTAGQLTDPTPFESRLISVLFGEGIDLFGVAGTITSIELQPQQAPEPGTLALIGLAIPGLIVSRRRTKSH